MLLLTHTVKNLPKVNFNYSNYNCFLLSTNYGDWVKQIIFICNLTIRPMHFPLIFFVLDIKLSAVKGDTSQYFESFLASYKIA